MSSSYQNKVLQWVMQEGILEEGEIVYCFVEDSEMFRVQTRRLVYGVDQINFPLASKHKFRIIQ